MTFEPIDMCLGKQDADEEILFPQNQWLEFESNIKSFMSPHENHMVSVEITPCSLSLETKHAYDNGILTIKLRNTGSEFSVQKDQTLFVFAVKVY